MGTPCGTIGFSGGPTGFHGAHMGVPRERHEVIWTFHGTPMSRIIESFVLQKHISYIIIVVCEHFVLYRGIRCTLQNCADIPSHAPGVRMTQVHTYTPLHMCFVVINCAELASLNIWLESVLFPTRVQVGSRFTARVAAVADVIHWGCESSLQ